MHEMHETAAIHATLETRAIAVTYATVAMRGTSAIHVTLETFATGAMFAIPEMFVMRATYARRATLAALLVHRSTTSVSIA
jgi:hypothetical protein